MEFECTTIELKKVYVIPSKQDIEQFLKDVQGFQEVEKVDRRKVIVKHNSGYKDQIGIKSF